LTRLCTFKHESGVCRYSSLHCIRSAIPRVLQLNNVHDWASSFTRALEMDYGISSTILGSFQKPSRIAVPSKSVIQKTILKQETKEPCTRGRLTLTRNIAQMSRSGCGLYLQPFHRLPQKTSILYSPISCYYCPGAPFSGMQKTVAYCQVASYIFSSNSNVFDMTWFFDETYFHVLGYVNSKDTLIWTTAGPHGIHEEYLHLQKVGVPSSLSLTFLISPYGKQRCPQHFPII
jgi:hypothetical protein